MRVLMVMTSHDRGNTGQKTGFWLEGFAPPFYAFQEAGAEITLASPKGGQPPIDLNSHGLNFQTDLTRRFDADECAKARLANTVRLDSVLLDDFDTVFYSGGYGPMWDLAEDQNSIDLIEGFIADGKTIAFVCQALAALRYVRNPSGALFVAGRRVTGFTNGEARSTGLIDAIPFLVEDEFLKLGAVFSKVRNWAVHIVVDGQLITGQNPASSGPAANALIDTLLKRARRSQA
jgi:putative intracellular protease/amidase